MATAKSRAFNGPYTGDHLAQIALPLGGMGAGMICLEGTGAFSRFSLRHRPQLHTERRVFAAVSIRGKPNAVRVLEGPVPKWKLRPEYPEVSGLAPFASWGLPRFTSASFEARFPFATVNLADAKIPLDVTLTGWSPFSPNDDENASLPVAALEYQLTNCGAASIEAVFSFHAENFMALAEAAADSARPPTHRIVPIPTGFILEEAGSVDRPWEAGRCALWLEESRVAVNPVWFRGPWWDQTRMLWNQIVAGLPANVDSAPQIGASGASLYVPFILSAGRSKIFKLHIAWYVPRSNLFEPRSRVSLATGDIEPIASRGPTYQPWYSSRFASLEEVMSYWQDRHATLRKASERFSRAFQDSTLPPEVLEAVAANLAILKSPTVLRQADGRLWCWEGCFDEYGSCYGSANHVWNYAQALAHLFPALERTLRETELGENLGRDGFQAIRAALPIRPIGDSREDAWGFPSAADGQLGTIIKTYREWRISGDRAWLERLWPKVRSSLDYCIETWDPRQRGLIEEPHINTYDRPLWGAEPLCTALYIGALKAAVAMGSALEANVERYATLCEKGMHALETTLFNGEYFFQKTEWRSLRAAFPPPVDDPLGSILRQHPEMLALAEEWGPPYQYDGGCLSDGLMGAWLAWASGLGEMLDAKKIASHLDAVWRHNFRESLVDHAEAARPDSGRFASGQESGLLMCSWPKGGRPQLPMMFSDEVWTGVEYQVASHLISIGSIEEGLRIVRACRSRYDGRVRNPFDEIEAGHWYARAMSSYALLQAFSGARFDAVDRVLYLNPPIKGDFRCFLSTATGYGTVGVENGQPFVEVVEGEIPYRRIEYSVPS